MEPVGDIDQRHQSQRQQWRLPNAQVAGHDHQVGGRRPHRIVGERPEVALSPHAAEGLIFSQPKYRCHQQGVTAVQQSSGLHQ